MPLVSRRSFIGGLVATGGLVAALPARSRPASPTAPGEPDYLGYRRRDHDLPYAAYFTETVAPVQQQIRDAVAGPPTPAADIPRLADLATELMTPGYSEVENGYGMIGASPEEGIWSAALTRMPDNTPEMWDWWFGWHSAETARYKLWHPEAHLYASLRNNLADEPGLSDKERYIGNVSYVDEYLPDHHGGRAYYGDAAAGALVAPGIAFVDPSEIGVDISRFDGTVIVGRGGAQGGTDTDTLFAHQVRRVPGGAEMRTRFYFRGAPKQGYLAADPQVAAAAVARSVLPVAGRPPLSLTLLHAGQEMNHLARFLPALHREFRLR